MKSLVILLLSMLYVSAADTNGYNTNYVVAQQCFREVDGKLYNACKSELWHAKTGSVFQVMTNGILCQLKVESDFQLIFLKNYPASNAVDGDPVGVLAMRTGQCKWGANTLEKWDCGKPHVVAVNSPTARP